jgi:hypothetical protein
MIVTKAYLLAILDDIRAHVAADDSFEGSLQYLIPENGDGFELMASYRVDNLRGQGSIVHIEGPHAHQSGVTQS